MVTRIVDSSEAVSFAGTNYRAGRAWRGKQLQVSIVAGSVLGPLDVWSTTAPHRQCLAVVFASSVLRFNCTVSSLDTVADVTGREGWLPTDAPGGPIPDGSSVRFVLRDDVVDVYVGRNADPDALRAATEGPYPGNPFGAPLPHGGAELADTNWVLEGAVWGERMLRTGITLDFAADSAGGNGGVNPYTAGYTSAPDGALTFSDVASTAIAGHDAAMAAEEDAYLAALKTVTGYSISAGNLALFAGPDQIMAFSSAS